MRVPLVAIAAIAAVATLAALVAPPALAQVAGEGRCVENLQLFADQETISGTLTWNATPGAAFYDVHRSQDGGPFVHVGTVAAPATTFVDDGASPGVVEWKVAADGHPPEACAPVSVHFHGEEPPPPATPCPTNLTAVANANATITVSWDLDPFADAFRVERAEAGGPFLVVAELGSTAREFVDEDVEPGVAYRYRVNAVISDLPSQGCEEVEATAVPFFGGAFATALALVAGLAALVVRRRA